MLEFIYRGTIERTLFEKNVREILIIAEKYIITPLKEECERYISESMSTKNFSQLVQFADTYSCEIIMEVSWILMNFMSSSFLGVPKVFDYQLRANHKFTRLARFEAQTVGGC